MDLVVRYTKPETDPAKEIETRTGAKLHAQVGKTYLFTFMTVGFLLVVTDEEVVLMMGASTENGKSGAAFKIIDHVLRNQAPS